MKLPANHSLAIAFIAAMALAACTSPAATTPAPTSPPTIQPTETQAATPTLSATATSPAPTASGPSLAGCILGTWQVSDFNSYMNSVLPQEALQNGEISMKDTSGALTYVFDSSGKVDVNAQQFKVTAEITVSSVSLPLDIVIVGAGTADYKLNDAGTIQFSNLNGGNISFKVSISGTSVTSSGQNLLTLGGADTTSVEMAYECSGNTLKLTPPVKKTGVQPVVFTRIGS